MLYKLGFCPNGPDCRYRHAKLPGPPPPVEEVLQKIQHLISHNYANSNRFFQNRNYPQQTDRSQLPQGTSVDQVVNPTTRESPNVQQQQQPQQVQPSQHHVSQVHEQNLSSGQQNQANRTATPLPQGISRFVQSSKVFI
ncbi:unnamed protein product [Ilex paraguariensis]|uniref:C3H1-type domain-containing protein n=1 Tax=Ilex paraguariensis TaxID=185542 RepID=A0ABC8RLH0_9AQUA